LNEIDVLKIREPGVGAAMDAGQVKRPNPKITSGRNPQAR